MPFGFLRADPAGRLTKHFPLPGLPLPSSGHACPLWVIYEAPSARPIRCCRQVVQFADGSRYLFIAQAQPRRRTRFGERAIPTSIMLACDVLHADRTVYGAGLDLGDPALDVPVGPSVPALLAAGLRRPAGGGAARPAASPWRCARRWCRGVSILAKAAEYALVSGVPIGRSGRRGTVGGRCPALPRTSRAFWNRSTSSCAAPAGRSHR